MPYEKLFEKGRIGPLVLKNRGVMMPMATDLADRNGIVTPRQIAYYEARARGGVGMIIHEYTGVDDEDSIPSIHNLRIARDYHISELEKLTDAVHKYGCRIICQLHHGGATSNPAFTGRQSLAPSAVPIAEGRPVPREMTLEDIRRVQGKFADAAVRAQRAGYDGVELHGAHGYLIAQFFSKYYNRRTDAYGGSVENRCRFIAEIIAEIRARLGRSFPILVRMCGDEMTPVPGFLTLEDGLEIAKYLESCGIDAINISNGSARNGDANCEPGSYQPGWKKHVAKAYKAALHIPVIATNTVKTPDFAEALLAEGVSDFVGLGRSQLADPEFMNKARAGRADEIRGCIGCLYCRERVLGQALPIRCAVNARTGREDEFPELRRDGAGRAAVVIGGGPAGMECARALALRDFRVTLFEKESALGGTLNIADKPPFKNLLADLIAAMETQLRRLNVDIRLGTPATVEAVRALDPAGVFMACGADPVVPPLPGIGGPQVMKAEDVLAGRAAPRGRTAVIGTGLTGLETAETLAGQGLPLALVEMLPALGPGIYGPVLNDTMSRITPCKPAVYVGHKLLAVEPGCIRLERVNTGEIVTVEVQSVVLALGVRSRTALVEQFEAAFPRVAAIGDAYRGGRIATAVRQGFEAAYVFSPD
jgi:2,4-dienoyl-CoA reductase-like NADH-dependent reductase (Old Yellow Enzyme family)/thioredoxin reductase